MGSDLPFFEHDHSVILKLKAFASRCDKGCKNLAANENRDACGYPEET